MNDTHDCVTADEASASIERALTTRLGRRPNGDQVGRAFETARRTGWLADCPDHPERYVLQDGSGNVYQPREPLQFTNRAVGA